MNISKEIREQVRQRAGKRCEYCRKPEGFSARRHQIDHIIARKHEVSSDELDNLAYSCLQCNGHKGALISSYDALTGELTPLFHPRLDQWHVHFEISDEYMIGKTAIGRVTIYILNMNSQSQLETRKALIAAGLW